MNVRLRTPSASLTSNHLAASATTCSEGGDALTGIGGQNCGEQGVACGGRTRARVSGGDGRRKKAAGPIEHEVSRDQAQAVVVESAGIARDAAKAAVGALTAESGAWGCWLPGGTYQLFLASPPIAIRLALLQRPLPYPASLPPTMGTYKPTSQATHHHIIILCKNHTMLVFTPSHHTRAISPTPTC